MNNKFIHIKEIIDNLCTHDIARLDAFDELLRVISMLSTYDREQIGIYLNRQYGYDRTYPALAISDKKKNEA